MTDTQPTYVKLAAKAVASERQCEDIRIYPTGRRALGPGAVGWAMESSWDGGTVPDFIS